MGWAWGGENLVGVLALGRVGTHWSRTGPLNPTHFWHWKIHHGVMDVVVLLARRRDDGGPISRWLQDLLMREA